MANRSSMHMEWVSVADAAGRPQLEAHWVADGSVPATSPGAHAA